jgi:hypothetical protein
MGPTSNSLTSSLEFMTRSSDLNKHICIKFGYYDKVQVVDINFGMYDIVEWTQTHILQVWN